MSTENEGVPPDAGESKPVEGGAPDAPTSERPVGRLIEVGSPVRVRDRSSPLRHLGEARRKQESRALSHVEDLMRAALEGPMTELGALRAEVRDLRESLRQLVRANNAAAIVVNCVETHLDKVAPGWDEGERERATKRAALLAERAGLAGLFQRVPAKADDADRAARVEAAHRLWEVAKELGTDAVDCAMVLALLVQSRNLTAAREFLETVRKRDDFDGLDPETRKSLDRLTLRLRQLLDSAPPELKSVPKAEGEAPSTEPAPDVSPPATAGDDATDCAVPVYAAPPVDPDPEPAT